jgi:hypothetical protein
MSIFHPHRAYPEDILPIPLALWWRDASEVVLRVLLSPKYRGGQYESNMSGNLLIQPPKNLIMENEMNGRKSKPNGTKPSSSNGQSAAFRWINVALTTEDIDILERQAINLEQLALHLIQLVGSGYGVSVKYDNARKSYNVSIYGSDNRNGGQPCGISGSATDLRDALLVSLFRFSDKLQGSFDGCANPDSDVQPARFR